LPRAVHESAADELNSDVRRHQGGDTPPSESACTTRSRKHTENLDAVFAQAPISICMLQGPEQRFAFANPACHAALGKMLVIGEPLGTAFPELAQDFGPIIRRVLETGEPFIGHEIAAQLAHRRPGQTSYMNLVYQPSRDPEGAIQGVLVFGFDVTEQVVARRAEAAVEAQRLSEMQFRLAIRSAGLIVFGQDLQLRHVWIHNPVPGFTPDAIIGKSDRDLHTPENAERLERVKLRALGGEAVREEVTLHWPDSVAHYQLTVEPHRDGSGAIDGLIGACLDITEQVCARESLAALAARLEAAVELRDDFLSIAGHELKTPLAALLMHIQSIQRARKTEGTPPKLDERLAKAANAAGRLDKLINQMLDVSRISAGRLELDREMFCLGDVLRDVVDRFAEQAERAGSTIVLHAGTDVRGSWDRFRTDQVFTNLIANALKYGNGQPIDVELVAHDDGAEVRVIDRGIGIDPSQQHKIFERFERAVGTREFGGFGLGLWICRQIVDASGGRISVVSAPGKGSTFEVWLPRVTETT